MQRQQIDEIGDGADNSLGTAPPAISSSTNRTASSCGVRPSTTSRGTPPMGRCEPR
jgi:hypothetical protein